MGTHAVGYSRTTGPRNHLGREATGGQLKNSIHNARDLNAQLCILDDQRAALGRLDDAIGVLWIVVELERNVSRLASDCLHWLVSGTPESAAAALNGQERVSELLTLLGRMGVIEDTRMSELEAQVNGLWERMR
jgi:hypothetical protein